MTNVIKHAQASKLSIEGSVKADGGATISITDDGVGLSVDHGDGRGLTSMRSRARELGAELSVQPLVPGTRVLVSIRPE